MPIEPITPLCYGRSVQQEAKMKIDRNVPPPVDNSRDGIHWRKYPFPDMRVGDSLFLEGEDGRLLKLAAKSFQYLRRADGWKYRSRQENGGTRVWRVA